MQYPEKCTTQFQEPRTNSPQVIDSVNIMHLTMEPDAPGMISQKYKYMINYFCRFPSSMIPSNASTSSDPLVNEFLQALPYVTQIPTMPLQIDPHSHDVTSWRKNPFPYDEKLLQNEEGINNVPCSETFVVYLDPEKLVPYNMTNTQYDVCVDRWYDVFSKPYNGTTVCASSAMVLNPVTNQYVTLYPTDEEQVACIDAGGYYSEDNDVIVIDPDNDLSDNDTNGLSTAAIVGISLGSAAVVAAVIAGFVLYKKSKETKVAAPQPKKTSTTVPPKPAVTAKPAAAATPVVAKKQ